MPVTDFRKQFRFLGLRVRLMDEGDLLRRDSLCGQFLPYILIDAGFHGRFLPCDIQGSVPVRQRAIQVHALGFPILPLGFLFRLLSPLWRGKIRKNKLRPSGPCRLLPYPEHGVYAGVHFAARVVREQRVHEPLLQGQLAPVRCHFQHVVVPGVYLFPPYPLRPPGQFPDHLFLRRGAFRLDGDVFRLRHREFQHLRRLDVRRLLPAVHQLRQVVEAGKPGL